MARSPRILLVYPEFPPSYWGFRYAIELMDKRSAMPPLGLLTVAAMIPARFELRLVDVNVAALTDPDLDWADLVLTSSMIVQRRSLQEVIARSNRRGKPVAVGGPHPSSCADEIAGADYYVLDEVEETFPLFLADWEAGRAQRLYRPEHKPAITTTPVPRFDLLDLGAYSSMALQFSRGCPFDCEFCDITKLFGRVPRTKSNPQMLAELDALYDLGWRGPVFLVDDNFIGNRREALRLLPDVAAWQRQRAHPFDLFTEASVNLAQHEPLMDAMVAAGFSMVFLGIESPNPEALRKTRKSQNVKRDEDDFLLRAVRTIQRKGLEVSGGFILGLDADGPEIFDAQIDFIQAAGIPRAMVGLLTALRGTDLHARYAAEGRLAGEASGNNVEIALNFRPQLAPAILIAGYRRVLATLYDPGLKSYFARCRTLLANLGPGVTGRRHRFEAAKLLALLRSLRRQSLSRQGPAYLGFLFRTLLANPRRIALALRLAIMGLHFEKFTRQTLATHDFSAAARTDYERMEAESVAAVAAIAAIAAVAAVAAVAADGAAAPGTRLQEALRHHGDQALRRLRRLHRRLRPEFRKGLQPGLGEVERAIRTCVGEAPAAEILRHRWPQLESWFSGPSWRSDLEAQGYARVERWRAGSGVRTITLAPLLAQSRLRHSLERFFHELGVRVVTLGEQVARLAEERVPAFIHPEEARDRIVSYLGALAQYADTVVVPVVPAPGASGAPGAPGERLQVLAAHPSGAGVRLPNFVCVTCEPYGRELRAGLVEIGVALTGDAARAELALERAFALA